MMLTMTATGTIYTLVTTDMRGTIVDIELFSSRPTFELNSHQTLYKGDIDGGDTIRIA